MDGEVNNQVEKATEHYSKRLSIEEFFIDVLGGLVPGVLFIVASTLALFSGIHAVWASLIWEERKSLNELLANFFVATQNTPNAIWIMVFIVIFLLSYMLGYLFYRFDPKEVDKKSFERLKIKLDTIEKEKIEEHLGCATADDCHFPYPAYFKYLHQRGHHHLKDFIRWEAGDNDEAKNYRSKTYINLLKVRLRYDFPEKCGVIIRNEAHIRLASSTWYVSRVLFKISLVSFMICLVSLGITIALNSNPTKIIAWFMPNLLFSLLIGGLFFSIMNAIEGFFHYQRLREVFFVLETAYTAYRDRLHELNPPFDKFKTRRKQT